MTIRLVGSQGLCTTCLHDHKIGGQPGPMLYMAEHRDRTGQANEVKPDTIMNDGNGGALATLGDQNVVLGGGNGNGQGKQGYGECCHCRESGHTRRECPGWLKL